MSAALIAELAELQKAPDTSSRARAAMKDAATELVRLQRFERMYQEATQVLGDKEVLQYVTSGNAIPVTRCVVSADLIRQLVEGRRS